jgi:hypothetical protein
MLKLLSIKLRNLVSHQMYQMRTPLMAILDLFLVALLRVLKWEYLLNSYFFSIINTLKKKNSILMQTCPQSTQFSHVFLKIIYQFNRLNLKNLIIPTQFEGIINFFSNLDFSRPPISVLNLNVKRTKAKYIISI